MWELKLGEFDFQFTHMTSMKGQAVIDFIMECTIPPTLEDRVDPKDN